jgi:hypothetical protein
VAGFVPATAIKNSTEGGNNHMKQTLIIFLILTAIFTTSFSNLPKEEQHLMFLRSELPVEGEKKVGYIIYADKKAGEYVHTDANGEGISCVDDTARAGLYFLNKFVNLEDKNSVQAKRYQSLLLETVDFCEAFRTRTGDYYNFVFEDGEINRKGITSRPSASWWALRELWLLSEALNVLGDSEDFNRESIYKKAEQTATLFIEELDSEGLIRGYSDLSALYVISLVNLYDYSEDENWLNLVQTVSNGLLSKKSDVVFNGIIDEGKDVFNYHSWGSRQVQALSMAYSVTQNEDYLSTARAMADSLYTHMINIGPFYNFTPTNMTLFSQIAYGTEAAVTSLYHLYEVSGEEKYALLMALHTGFFFGNNHLNRMMVGKNGEGFDGLEKVFINSNSGAESTISYLLSLSLLERLPEEITKFAFMQPVHKSDYLLIEAENMDSGLSNCDTEVRNGIEGVAGQSFILKEPFKLEKGKYDVFIFGDDLEEAQLKFYMGKSKIEQILTSENPNYLGRVENLTEEELRIIFSCKSEKEVFINQILCLPVIEYQIFKEGEINHLIAFNTTDETVTFEYQTIDGNGYLQSETNFDLRAEDIESAKVLFEIETDKAISGFSILNLEKAMTNNGIGTALQPGNLDNYSGKTGAYYPEEKITAKTENDIVYFNEIPFRISTGEQDNLIPGGQVLKVNESADVLYLFGSCDHGSFSGDIEVCYSDHEKEYFSLSFPDWCADIRDEGIIALEVPYRYDSNNLKEWIKPKIYALELQLKGKEIDTVAFPEIPTMHVFGMTLKTN